MNIDSKNIMNLLHKGEGIDLEFKTCQNQLNRDIYETVCAFLNRVGGTILLGINDNGEVLGVNPDAVLQIKKAFTTTINNPQKISPPAYLSIHELKMQGKILLYVYVPESSQVHRCNNHIYDRNEDGDFDITDHTSQVAMLYQRKQMIYSENKVFPHIQVEHLRHDLIDKCRRIIRINSQGHPWADMDDKQLIQSAQLYQYDSQTKESGVTLAGILLFGPDALILNTCPAHRTDLILRRLNVDRYDDRDLVRTNLIDSYDRIIAFVQKYLPDPFYLEGVERTSLRDVIFREIASNMLIHREYISGVPSRLIIGNGEVITENANRPHGFGQLDLNTYVPYPKNPVIGAFFREIYRADELGSGMRKLKKYGKTYGGETPQMIEGDLFRMVVKVPEFNSFYKTIEHFDFSNRVNESKPDYKKGVYDDSKGGVHDDEKGVHDDEKGVHDDLKGGVHDDEKGVHDDEKRVHDKIKGVHDDLKGGVHDDEKGVHDDEKGVHDDEKGVHDDINDVRLTNTMSQLLKVLSLPKSTTELLKILGYSGRTRSFVKSLTGLLDAKLIEMTIPDKPRSKKQQYRLTSKGKKLIHIIENNR